MVAQGDLTWLAEMNAHMLSCFVDKFNESNGKQCCRFRNHMRCFFIRTTYFMSSSHRIYPQHEHTQHKIFCYFALQQQLVPFLQLVIFHFVDVVSRSEYAIRYTFQLTAKSTQNHFGACCWIWTCGEQPQIFVERAVITI